MPVRNCCLGCQGPMCGPCGPCGPCSGRKECSGVGPCCCHAVGANCCAPCTPPIGCLHGARCGKAGSYYNCNNVGGCIGGICCQKRRPC